MDGLVCKKCGKPIKERHYLIQVIEYLGGWSPRVDICDDCYQNDLKWLFKSNKEGTQHD